jgi:hypothetical protein
MVDMMRKDYYRRRSSHGGVVPLRRGTGFVLAVLMLGAAQAALPPHEATASGGAPTVSITVPSHNESYSGLILVEGTASNGTVVVMVRIDGGIWTPATGTSRWSLRLDTWGFDPGGHTLEVRSYDGAGYSEVARVEFLVEQRTSTVGSSSPWPLIGVVAVVILMVASVGLAVRSWRRRGLFE